jgi:hypothetical protein
MNAPRQESGTSAAEAVLLTVIYAALIAGYFFLAALIG